MRHQTLSQMYGPCALYSLCFYTPLTALGKVYRLSGTDKQTWHVK